MKQETFDWLKKVINDNKELIAAERKEIIAVISELVDNEDKIPFETFWEKYPKKQGKFNTSKTWKMMSAKNQHLALELLPIYLNAKSPYIHDPENYLHGRMWMDYVDNKPKTKLDLFGGE